MFTFTEFSFLRSYYKLKYYTENYNIHVQATNLDNAVPSVVLWVPIWYTYYVSPLSSNLFLSGTKNFVDNSAPQLGEVNSVVYTEKLICWFSEFSESIYVQVFEEKNWSTVSSLFRAKNV